MSSLPSVDIRWKQMCQLRHLRRRMQKNRKRRRGETRRRGKGEEEAMASFFHPGMRRNHRDGTRPRRARMRPSSMTTRRVSSGCIECRRARCRIFEIDMQQHSVCVCAGYGEPSHPLDTPTYAAPSHTISRGLKHCSHNAV